MYIYTICVGRADRRPSEVHLAKRDFNEALDCAKSRGAQRPGRGRVRRGAGSSEGKCKEREREIFIYIYR